MLNQIFHILQLPEKCFVNKKITKAFFKRNFDMTSAERNLLDDANAVISIDWIASISQANANVTAWQDAESTFEEIEVIVVTTNTEYLNKQAIRIIDLIHKYIPYHLLVVVTDGAKTVWSVAYKRINQNDTNKRTVDRKFTSEIIELGGNNAIHKAFIESLNFSKLASTDLKVLYDSYVQCFVGLNTAPIIGAFETRPAERTREDVEILEKINQLEKEITSLSKATQKETQLNKRIEMNTLLQQKRKQIEQLKNTITNA
ncbi:DUF4391 domain-containing protein [Flavobacterium filum]|uniref:DUF4391 domain-containing protein n=1 Tax=Flavobacterium filum TaxID=370974 RepID=UPI0023F3127E|nr:DUF4391 domain-containing protein [Flavobacterium filum]